MKAKPITATTITGLEISITLDEAHRWLEIARTANVDNHTGSNYPLWVWLHALEEMLSNALLMAGQVTKEGAR